MENITITYMANSTSHERAIQDDYITQLRQYLCERGLLQHDQLPFSQSDYDTAHQEDRSGLARICAFIQLATGTNILDDITVSSTST